MKIFRLNELQLRQPKNNNVYWSLISTDNNDINPKPDYQKKQTFLTTEWDQVFWMYICTQWFIPDRPFDKTSAS